MSVGRSLTLAPSSAKVATDRSTPMSMSICSHGQHCFQLLPPTLAGVLNKTALSGAGVSSIGRQGTRVSACRGQGLSYLGAEERLPVHPELGLDSQDSEESQGS